MNMMHTITAACLLPGIFGFATSKLFDNMQTTDPIFPTIETSAHALLPIKYKMLMHTKEKPSRKLLDDTLSVDFDKSRFEASAKKAVNITDGFGMFVHSELSTGLGGSMLRELLTILNLPVNDKMVSGLAFLLEACVVHAQRHDHGHETKNNAFTSSTKDTSFTSSTTFKTSSSKFGRRLLALRQQHHGRKLAFFGAVFDAIGDFLSDVGDGIYDFFAAAVEGLGDFFEAAAEIAAELFVGASCGAFATATLPGYEASYWYFTVENSNLHRLTDQQQFFLASIFDADLLSRVRIKYSADMAPGFGGKNGVTMGNRLYLSGSEHSTDANAISSRQIDADFYRQTRLLAHEIAHVEQYRRLMWSETIFGWDYMYEYCAAGFSYRDNVYERAARREQGKADGILQGRAIAHFKKWRYDGVGGFAAGQAETVGPNVPGIGATRLLARADGSISQRHDYCVRVMRSAFHQSRMDQMHVSGARWYCTDTGTTPTTARPTSQPTLQPTPYPTKQPTTVLEGLAARIQAEEEFRSNPQRFQLSDTSVVMKTLPPVPAYKPDRFQQIRG